MPLEIVCRKCGRTHTSKEYLDSRFCRKCGTFLSLPKPKVRVSTPSLRISPKAELREYPKIKRAEINTDIAYLLGLFMARGELREESLVIRVPCRFQNASDHKDFLLGYVVPRMEKATGEKVGVHGDVWSDYSFDITIRNDFFLKLLARLELRQGEVCRFAGAPFEIFNANNDVKRDFVRGIGDCCGELDRYIGGKPRVVLRFLNENTWIIEDVVELLVRLSTEIFDVNLSPAPTNRQETSLRLDELKDSLRSRYGVKVTGRLQRTGRDNMIRMWAEEYYAHFGFNHPLRQTKLLRYLSYL